MVTTSEKEDNLAVNQSNIDLQNLHNGIEPEVRTIDESVSVLNSDDNAINNIAVLDQENKCIGDIEIHALESGKRPAIKTKADGNNDTSLITSKNVNIEEKTETVFNKIDAIENKSFARRERSFMDFICCRNSYSVEN